MKQKTVYVGSLKDYQAPSKPLEFIEKINQMLLSVPLEYRSTATLEIEAVDDYGDHYAEIDISYSRPETNIEKASRKSNEDRVKEYDIINMKKLMEKYPDEI